MRRVASVQASLRPSIATRKLWLRDSTDSVEFHLVAERDGTCVQAVGGYGRNAECTGLGHDDGASYAQGITGGTRGRVDDEAVSLISGQKFAIHFHPDGNHGGIVPFQDSHFVQGIWVSRRVPDLRISLR